MGVWYFAIFFPLIIAHPSKAVVPDESKKAQLRRHRQVERQARRRRRKDARQKEGIPLDQHNEGMSTDDEEKESDKQTFVQQIGEYYQESIIKNRLFFIMDSWYDKYGTNEYWF